MKFIGDVSSDAHVRVMANTKPGIMEYQMEALFKVKMKIKLILILKMKVPCVRENRLKIKIL